VSNLTDVTKVYDNCCFVSYLTVEPSKISVEAYMDTVADEVLQNSENELWLLGHKVADAASLTLKSNVKSFSSIDDLLKLL